MTKGPRRALAGALLLFYLCCLTPRNTFAQLQTPVVTSATNVGTIAVRVTRFGPYPASFTVPAGPILLYVSNQSGVLLDDYSFVLKSSTPGPIASVASLFDLHSDNTKHRDRAIIQPEPGQYELHFKSHPDWIVSITITAK